jgi:hypothetical protein
LAGLPPARGRGAFDSGGSADGNRDQRSDHPWQRSVYDDANERRREPDREAFGGG